MGDNDMMYYTGTEAECIALDAAISANCNWPSNGTTHWATPKETTVAGVYAIPVPEGYGTGEGSISKATMTNGISDTEQTGIEFPTEE
jgi:hypothetical protein